MQLRNKLREWVREWLGLDSVDQVSYMSDRVGKLERWRDNAEGLDLSDLTGRVRELEKAPKADLQRWAGFVKKMGGRLLELERYHKERLEVHLTPDEVKELEAAAEALLEDGSVPWEDVKTELELETPVVKNWTNWAKRPEEI